MATHIRGGYLTARKLTGYRYEFILTIFRNTDSPVVDPTNNIYPDASLSDVLAAPIFNRTNLPGKQTEIILYKAEYTYNSPGVYVPFHYQLNRNESVLNMDNSINTTFYVETKINIDPFLVFDNGPIVTKPAVDFAQVGTVYRYNPGAFDPDGDSLSYEHVPSKQFLQGPNTPVTVPNYRDPAVRSGGLDSSGSRASFTSLNTQTGDFVWNVPRIAGEFNTAIKIIQWRRVRPNRVRRDSIGHILLDIQIIVKDGANKRPLLILPKDTCVVAGAALSAVISAGDPDPNDVVKIRMLGELDSLEPASRRAVFTFNPSLTPPFSGDFFWQTTCSDVRSMPYQATFEAQDIPVLPVPLVDLRVWRIKVVGPSPILKKVVPDGNGRLRLFWQKYICSNIDKILIYRKIDSSQIQLDTCSPGMPGGNSFTLIAEVAGSDTTFLDDNRGLGLKKGPAYCYRIVARFPNPGGGESLVSNEICQALKLDIPVIVNVDVEKTSASAGEILVRWTRPFYIDTAVFKPPYTIELIRFAAGSIPVTVKSTTDTTDTTYTDTGLNTENQFISYQIRMRYGNLPNLADSSEKASSVRLDLRPGIKKIGLNWTASTPWTNNGFWHRIFRKSAGNFELIDSIKSENGTFQYTDEGRYKNEPLEDTVEYCYYVQTKGAYGNLLIAEPLLNKSQQACASPTDTIKPCPPPGFEVVEFNCPDCPTLRTQTEFSRTLKWRPIQQDTCGKDFSIFRIYYARYEDDPLVLLATTSDTFFVHSSLTTLSGCYAVSSVDRSGNESVLLNRTCKDNDCFRFDLPNLITLNRDSKNDVFTPVCISRAFVESVDFEVYNRWGKKIFEGRTEPEINWGGLTENNLTQLSDGIYFYYAKVKGKRLRRADEDMNFKGWIMITN
jgi:hypothetical protein